MIEIIVGLIMYVVFSWIGNKLDDHDKINEEYHPYIIDHFDDKSDFDE